MDRFWIGRVVYQSDDYRQAAFDAGTNMRGKVRAVDTTLGVVEVVWSDLTANWHYPNELYTPSA